MSAVISVPVLASITLGAPLLAWGLIGALAPILLHLLLRRRPRPVIFPAARLLLTYQSAEIRAQRLRYIILLSLRSLLILLLAALLMRVGCESGGSSAGVAATAVGGPPSAVFCIDDSASMGYRFRGNARLRCAADAARNLLADATRFPPGSEAALVTTGPGAEVVPLTTGLSAVARRLDGLRPASHDGPVTVALSRAYLLLAGARNQRKEVYLFTDLAAHAWRRDLPKFPQDLASVTIVDVGDPENDNACLAWPTLPDQSVPLDTPFEIPILVRAGDRPVDAAIELTIDGRPRGRQAIGRVSANSHREAPLALPALPRGTHALTLALLPPDALDADNRRFAWVNIEPRDQVIVVADEPAGEVAVMVEAMISPAALGSASRRFEVTRLKPSDVTLHGIRAARAVVLADAAGVSSKVWDALAGYLTAGGLVMIIPGPLTTTEKLNVGDKLLPAPAVSVETCPTPLTVAAANLSHPWLKPFADTAVDTINDRLIYRRLRVGDLSVDSTSIAPFTDGQPAILTRRIGRGQSVLLAFSPARVWSQLGSQAGPMIVFIQTALTDPARQTARIDHLTAGRPESRWLETAGDGQLLLTSPASGDPGLRLPAKAGLARIPTEVPGSYVVAAETPASRTLLHYAVNVAESESDGSRIAAEAAIALFPPGKARVLGADAAANGALKTGRQAVSWAIPVLLALLAALVVESAFANRFYGFLGARDPR